MDEMFFKGGPVAMFQTTDVSNSEFNVICNQLKRTVSDNLNQYRCRKSHFNPKDVELMTLTVTKHAGNWYFTGRMSKVKGPAYEIMFLSFICLI